MLNYEVKLPCLVKIKENFLGPISKDLQRSFLELNRLKESFRPIPKIIISKKKYSKIEFVTNIVKTDIKQRILYQQNKRSN